jgi:hypothetical protein
MYLLVVSRGGIATVLFFPWGHGVEFIREKSLETKVVIL